MKDYITTPIGRGAWLSLTTPDTKFDPDGVFQAALVLDPKDAEVKDFLASLEQRLEEYLPTVLNDLPPNKAKNLSRRLPWDEEYDRDSGEPTGNVLLKTKCKALGKTKAGTTYPVKVSVYDRYNQPYTGDAPASGSKLRVTVQANTYYMPSTNTVGISLRLRAAQIIEARTLEPDTAEGFGFAPMPAAMPADDESPF